MAFYPQFDGLTDEQLKAASWWLVHKQRVVLILFITFLTITCSLWLWLGFKITIFFTQEKKDLAAKQAQLIQQANFAVVKPADLIAESPVFFYNSNNTLDLAAKITNPNPDWEVSQLKFQFTVADQTVPGKTIYLGPQQTTLLVVMSLPWHQSMPDQVKLTIEPSWRQVAVAPDKVAVADSEISQNRVLTQATWQATNHSLRNYWLVPFTVAAYSQGQLVAVNAVSIEKLKINENRAVAASWYGDLPNIDQIEVFSQLDPYDSANWWTSE